jgi:hypothetical protein
MIDNEELKIGLSVKIDDSHFEGQAETIKTAIRMRFEHEMYDAILSKLVKEKLISMEKKKTKGGEIWTAEIKIIVPKK